MGEWCEAHPIKLSGSGGGGVGHVTELSKVVLWIPLFSGLSSGTATVILYQYNEYTIWM